MKIAVIGAGASGLAAALQAAWHGVSVTLFERNPVPGKKLQVTGSGRCNITNDAVTASKYSCADPAWMETVLSSFGVSDLLAMLHEIGVPTYKTFDGWYYPLSDSAKTVVDALENAVTLAGCAIHYATQVQDVRWLDHTLFIDSVSPDGRRKTAFDRVIVATGGKSFPSLGSRGELFPVLERLGHTMLPKRPALAPVLTDMKEYQPLQGVRLDVGVTLWEDTKNFAQTAGNLIFTQWGLNGPAVMDLSHHISARQGAKLVLSLNLLHFHQAEYDELLSRKKDTLTPLMVFLEAFFPPKVAAFFIHQMNLPLEIRLNELKESDFASLTRMLNNLPFTVMGVKGFEYCQLSVGGVPVTEVDPKTLVSKIIQDLYLTGETLDVVGPCGGFNLQFAFSSGALAGRAAASGG
jgi:hypothetical protein